MPEKTAYNPAFFGFPELLAGLRTRSLVKICLILSMLTSSFDIFLVLRLGFNFRISQFLVLIPIAYALLLIPARPAVRWPLGFTPLLLWTLCIGIFIPNTAFILRSAGYFVWLVFSVLTIFAAVQLIDSEREAIQLVRWYLYSFLLVATFGIFQFFAPLLGLGAPLIQQWWIRGVLPRINGFSYEPSYYASYLIMGWVLSLSLLQQHSPILSRKMLWFTTAVLTLALILSSSRSGVVAMAIWLAQYPLRLGWRLLQGGLHKKMLAITAALALVCLLLAVAVSIIGGERLTFLLAGVGLLGQAAHSVIARAHELRDTLTIFCQSPIIGYSLGGISSAIAKLRGIEITSLEMAKQNEGMSVFAEVLAASGLLGAFPFAIYIWKIVRAPLKLAGATWGGRLKPVLAGLAYALIIELLILQFNQNILRIYLWMHIAILSAVYAVARRQGLSSYLAMAGHANAVDHNLQEKSYRSPKLATFLDARWIGDHGIGRFAAMLDHHLGLPHLALNGKPWSPTDPLRLWLALRRLPRDNGVLCPGYNAPLFTSRPFIFTIHDLNHLERPENSSRLKRLYYRLIIRRAARQAFRVLTVSEFSRQRIIRWSGLSPERVVNVGNGVDDAYCPGVKPYAPGYPYLLCVGNRKAHKNEARLTEAFARADIPREIRLLFTGAPSDELNSLIRNLSVTDRVVFLCHVAEAEMPGIYRGALALIFPSLYEGFGLPVIEAMACGTPVLTANTTALPEVAGDAALLVDPLSIPQMSRGIEQLCGNEKLREELHKSGLERARLFSWAEVAKRVKSVIIELESTKERP